jgi:hypothetical protein
MLNLIRAEKSKLSSWKSLSLIFLSPIGFSILALFGAYQPILLSKNKKEIASSLLSIQSASGFTTAFDSSSVLFLIVALALFTSTFSKEYSNNIWKNLFVYQPSRMRIVNAKILVAISYLSLSIIVDYLFSTVLNLSIAGYANINVDKWLTTSNFIHSLNIISRNILAAALVGILGLGIVLITKSGRWAIGGVLGWLFLIEPLIGNFMPAVSKYLIFSNLESFLVNNHFGNSLVSVLTALSLIFATALLGLRGYLNWEASA